MKQDDEDPPETERLVSDDEANLEQQLEKLLLHRVKQEIKKSASDTRDDNDELDPDAQQVEIVNNVIYLLFYLQFNPRPLGNIITFLSLIASSPMSEHIFG